MQRCREKGKAMSTADRRRKITEKLTEKGGPLKGGDLAVQFGVSRQVIVQDMAVLRAEGLQVVATPRGYMLLSPLRPEGIVKTVVTRHGDYKSMEEELRIMVNNGARVLNVIVEHPVYGEITGNLMISTPEDVSRFMDNITGSEGEPLSSLTGGVHLHTLEVRDEVSWKKILSALKEKNYLPDEK